MAHRPLTGEPLPLDLVNTEWPEHGRLLDYLDDPADVRTWLAEHAEFGPVEAGASAALANLRVARGAIRLALEESDYGDLNAILEHGRLRLTMSDAGAVLRAELDDETWRLGWAAARAFVDLVSVAPPERIRQCDGPGCVLWFLDTTRNGRRRWCSMSGCGNRAKARAHYARRQA